METTELTAALRGRLEALRAEQAMLEGLLTHYEGQNLDAAEAAGEEARERAARQRTPRSRGPRTLRAAGGSRREQLLTLVQGNANTGISVREAAHMMGVDPTSLYRVVKDLQRAQQVRKEGVRLYPKGS